MTKEKSQEVWTETAQAARMYGAPLPKKKTPSERASEIVTGPRREAYGHPLPNHKRIAAFWTVRLKDKLMPGVTIEPHDVTALMRLVKEARLMNTPGHDDSLLDIAGYADVEWIIHHDPPRRDT